MGIWDGHHSRSRPSGIQAPISICIYPHPAFAGAAGEVVVVEFAASGLLASRTPLFPARRVLQFVVPLRSSRDLEDAEMYPREVRREARLVDVSQKL